jgi:hypothetical protein
MSDVLRSFQKQEAEFVQVSDLPEEETRADLVRFIGSDDYFQFMQDFLTELKHRHVNYYEITNGLTDEEDQI